MEALFSIIQFLVDYIVKEVNGALNADVKKRVFAKSGEIQNATINELQDRYSHLEDALRQATVLKYQEQIDADTKKKIVVGNIESISGAILLVIVLLVLLILITKK